MRGPAAGRPAGPAGGNPPGPLLGRTLVRSGGIARSTPTCCGCGLSVSKSPSPARPVVLRFRGRGRLPPIRGRSAARAHPTTAPPLWWRPPICRSGGTVRRGDLGSARPARPAGASMSALAGAPLSSRADAALSSRAGVRATAGVPSAARGSPGAGRRGETGSALLVTMAAGALVSALAGAPRRRGHDRGGRRGEPPARRAGVVRRRRPARGRGRRAVRPPGTRRRTARASPGSAPGRPRRPSPDGSVVDAAAETRAPGGGRRRVRRPRLASVRVGMVRRFSSGRPTGFRGSICWRGFAATPPTRLPTRRTARAAAWWYGRPRSVPSASGSAVEATLVRDAAGVRVVAWNVVR